MDTFVYFKTLSPELKKFSNDDFEMIQYAQKFVCGLIKEIFSDVINFPAEPFQNKITSQLAHLLKNSSIEIITYLIGSTYSLLLPPTVRQKNGVFFTPPSLANRLLDQVEDCGIDWANVKVLDPACGSGVFLVMVAKRMQNALTQKGKTTESVQLKHVMRNLKGYEIDAFSSWMADVFIQKTFSQNQKLEVRSNLVGCVEVKNSLQFPFPDEPPFDLVIGNPPYGKITLDQKNRKIWERSLFGHANLYGLFTDLAIHLCKPKGIIAYVTPTSFLGGQYFCKLRELLMKEAPPKTFDFITRREGVFEGVQQETMLSVFQKTKCFSAVSVSHLEVYDFQNLKVSKNGSYSLKNLTSQPWLIPRNKAQSQYIKQLTQLTHRLSDYGYRVSTGPLVWNRHKPRLSKQNSTGAVPVIWAESIPSDGSGKFRYKATAKNHFPWYTPQSSSDPNLVKSSCLLLQRTTSLEQRRRLVAAILPKSFLEKNGGVCAIENHLNMIKPIAGQQPKIPLNILMILLNSKILDLIFRCINGSTAVSAYELESLPLPSPEELVAITINHKNTSTVEMDNLIRKLYTNEKSQAAA